MKRSQHPSLPSSPLSTKPMLDLAVSPSDLESSATSFNSDHRNPFVASPEQDGFSHRPFSNSLFSTSDEERPKTPPSPEEKGKARARQATAHEDEAEKASNRIFDQLDVIKQLQRNIADSHLKLEKIGEPDEADVENQRWKHDWTWSFGSMGDDDGEPKKEGTETFVKTKEEREKANKAYQDMDDEFAARDVGIDGIMEQLAKLSTEMRKLHDLPQPVLFTSPETKPANSKTRSPTSDAHDGPWRSPEPKRS